VGRKKDIKKDHDHLVIRATPGGLDVKDLGKVVMHNEEHKHSSSGPTSLLRVTSQELAPPRAQFKGWWLNHTVDLRDKTPSLKELCIRKRFVAICLAFQWGCFVATEPRPGGIQKALLAKGGQGGGEVSSDCNQSS